MRREQEAVLSILRMSAPGKSPDGGGITLPVRDEDLTAILDEASAQTVLMQVSDTLIGAGIGSGTIRDRLFRDFAANIRTGYAQKELVALMERHAFPYVILKGEAAAAYYPKPELRTLGDVDFLIDPDMRDEIAKVLTDAGYAKSHAGHACHVVFQKPGAHLEMHFEPAGIPEGDAGEAIRAFMRKATAHYETKDIGNGPFRAPEGIYHALVLLLHMRHHMLGEGIGLRHLCDWAYFAEKTKDEPFWDELIPFLKDAGLSRFASAVTQTCGRYLGVEVSRLTDALSAAEEPLSEDARGSRSERVMEDIFDGGNFGHKDPERVQNFILISNRGKTGGKHGKFYYIFYALNSYVREHFHPFRRIYPLYPVFYMCVGVKYIRMIASGKRKSVRRLLPSASRRRQLLDSLGIF